MEELRQRSEACDQLIRLKNDEIRRLVDHVDSTQRRFSEFKDLSKKAIAEKVFELEREREAREFDELMRKKAEFGYPRTLAPMRTLDDWIDGRQMLRLREERGQVLAQLEGMQQEKRSSKGKRRRTVSHETSEDIKDCAKVKMTHLVRRLEEIDNGLSAIHAEKYDIAYRDKLKHEEVGCYFAKKNPENGLPAWPVVAGKYRVLRLIGRGGFSEVYKVYDLEALRYAALKLHTTNAKWDFGAKQAYDRHTARENDVYKQLDHPNIVQFYEVVEVDSQSFGTILEYCEGPDLDYQLKRYGAFSEKAAKPIIKQLLNAVRYLNEQTPKIIHYDLKPQNILFTKDGVAKVTDFGLCKVFEGEESKMELTSQGAGTYWYLAPECFDTEKHPMLISSKVDIWAIGAIFYQMLFGRKPFGNNMSQEKILKERVILRSTAVVFPDKPAISPEARNFIQKCLVYNQNFRMDIHTACDVFARIS